MGIPIVCFCSVNENPYCSSMSIQLLVLYMYTIYNIQHTIYTYVCLSAVWLEPAPRTTQKSSEISQNRIKSKHLESNQIETARLTRIESNQIMSGSPPRLISDEDLAWDGVGVGEPASAQTPSAKRAKVAKAQYIASVSGQPVTTEVPSLTEARLAALRAKADYMEQLAEYLGPPLPSSSSSSPPPSLSLLPSHSPSAAVANSIPSRDRLSAHNAVIFQARVASMNNSLAIRTSVPAAIVAGRPFTTWPPP